jgi:hypothetical protein
MELPADFHEKFYSLLLAFEKFFEVLDLFDYFQTEALMYANLAQEHQYEFFEQHQICDQNQIFIILKKSHKKSPG